MSVPRWVVWPSGSMSTGVVGSTCGTSAYWPKIADAIAASGMFGHGMTFSIMFMTCVASIAVTSSEEPPGSSE
jgi:hypothetical protein